jgi:histidinol-phosphate/aromatic aminotransferase/cobyric acid decarboxylase-like protein
VGRPFPPLKQHARITMGTPEEMQRAMEVFRAVLTIPAKAA